jgi:hypothetical protein
LAGALLVGGPSADLLISLLAKPPVDAEMGVLAAILYIHIE